MSEPRLRVLSLGAGVQSTTLALMATRGEIEPPDCAIFADTEGEPRAVYDHLNWLRTALSYPVHVVSAGNLWRSASTLRRSKTGGLYLKTSIPVFTKEGGELGRAGRQCTGDFKIEPIVREMRRLLGLRRVSPRSGVLVRCMIGISADEADRMKQSKYPWIDNTWPLVDRGMTRADCLEWMERRGYQRPPRSACIFCPFHDDAFWVSLPRDEFATACEQERQLQRAYATSPELRAVPYFHRSCVPLGEVAFKPKAPKPEQRAFGFAGECEGMCGV